MRIVLKPMGVVVIVAVFSGVLFALSHNPAGSSKAALPTLNPNNLISTDRWKFYTEGTAYGTMEPKTLSPAGVPLPGFHVNIASHTDKSWNVGMTNPLKVAFNANEKLTLHFWARAEKPSAFEVLVQKNTPGFPYCFVKNYQVGTTWKEYSAPVTTMPMANYESMVAIHCGYQDGWIEVAGMELTR